MQNIVINMCEKFHNDRLMRNDRSLADGKSDNNKFNNKNVLSAWRPVSGSKNSLIELAMLASEKYHLHLISYHLQFHPWHVIP